MQSFKSYHAQVRHKYLAYDLVKASDWDTFFARASKLFKTNDDYAVVVNAIRTALRESGIDPLADTAVIKAYTSIAEYNAWGSRGAFFQAKQSFNQYQSILCTLKGSKEAGINLDV